MSLPNPALDAVGYMAALRDDPSLRPGDGSLSALRDALAAVEGKNDTLRLILSHLPAMLKHKRSQSLLDYDAPPPKTEDWEALALAWRPDHDPWDSALIAARDLQSNARMMGQSQGGVRDVITG